MMIGRNALKQFSWGKSAIRIYSTQIAEAVQQKQDADWINAKPYNEIPGPTIFSLLTSFLPYGKYHGMQITDMHQAWKTAYGDIVRIPGFLGRSDTILTYDPAMVEKVFRTEGPFPVRRGLETFNYYRKKVRPEIFGDVGGLLSEDGDKWWDIRSKANPVLLQPKTVKMYIEKVDQVAQEFITKIKQMRDVESLEVRDKFGHELNRWALESIGVIALDERLGALWDSDTSADGQQVIELVKEFFVLSYELDVSISIWKYYKTPKFNRMMWIFDQMTEKIMKRVDNAVARLESLKEANGVVSAADKSVLEKLLLIDRRIAIVMAFDMLLAGIDTTSTALVGVLYHLAKNPDKQELLREEVLKCLPTRESQLTNDSLNNMSYMRACLKEALRLSPVLAGNARQTGRDVVISGYQVPKGVEVAMGNSAMQIEESYFPKSKTFIPERWIKNNQNCEYALAKGTNSFVYLPFGFGPRSCIGRRFAEMEVFVLLSRIIREFKVEYNYGPLQYKTSLIQSPPEDLRFKFIDVDK